MAKSLVPSKRERPGTPRKPSRAKVLSARANNETAEVTNTDVKAAVTTSKRSKITRADPAADTVATRRMSKRGGQTKPIVKSAPVTTGVRRKFAVRAPIEFAIRNDENSITVLMSKDLWHVIQEHARENRISARLLLNTVLRGALDTVPATATDLAERIAASKIGG